MGRHNASTGQGLSRAWGSGLAERHGVNALGQLPVKNDNRERSVETVKLMMRVMENQVLQVPDGIDGLEVTLRCSCVVCNQEFMLHAAGWPKTVQVYTCMSVDEYVTAFVQTMEPDFKFPVGYHL